MRQAVLQRDVKLVVPDPRKIELCEFVTLHLQHKPGTNIALVNGLMHIIFEKGYENKQFVQERTENLDAFMENLKSYPPDKVSQITGVHNVFAIADLQMVLGDFGIPGGGVNPLSGQNNVQGACDMGCLVNIYPGSQAVANEVAQQKFVAAWGTTLSNKAGKTVTEVIL